MLKFFVEEQEEIIEIYRILRACDFPVRKDGVGNEDEICFFYNPQKKGINFNAYKIIKENLPAVAANSPFVVSVGEKWSKRGLLTVVEGYTKFFVEGLPMARAVKNSLGSINYLNPELMGYKDATTPFLRQIVGEHLVGATKDCIVLPWGGFPKGKQNQEDLIFWLEWVSEVFSLEDSP